MSRAENLAILHRVAANRQVTPAMLTMLEHVMGAESGGERYAANPGSSARGVYQFINSTWLGMLKTHGGKFGHSQFSQHIRWTGEEWTIDDAKLKQQALDLRYDVKLSCEMGIQLAYDNQCALQNGLKRNPTAGELYLAHFLGARDALKVLNHPNANEKIESLLSARVMNSNASVRLRRGGSDTLFKQFTVADIQQWAAGKMDQELSYEQLSEQNRQASWRRRHPRQVAPGQKDDFSDMVESLGDMTMSIMEFIGVCIMGAVTAIGNILGISNRSPDAPLPTPVRTASTNTPVPPRG